MTKVAAPNSHHLTLSNNSQTESCKIVKTTYAEQFLCSSDREDKNRSTQRAEVYHTNVQTKIGISAQTTSVIKQSAPTVSAPGEESKWQQTPRCFLCSTETSEKRHFLYNCDNYQRWTPEEKRKYHYSSLVLPELLAISLCRRL